MNVYETDRVPAIISKIKGWIMVEDIKECLISESKLERQKIKFHKPTYVISVDWNDVKQNSSIIDYIDTAMPEYIV